MGLRYRKIISPVKGIRFNFSRSGLSSLSFGPRGKSYSVGKNGKRGATVGMPGTGFYWREEWNKNSRRSLKDSGPLEGVGRAFDGSLVEDYSEDDFGEYLDDNSSGPPLDLDLPQPSLTAPQYEKDFYQGILLMASGDKLNALIAFEKAASADENNIVAADDFFAGILSHELDDREAAIFHFERLLSSQADLPDELMERYVPEGNISIALSNDIIVETPLGISAAILSLSECYASMGKPELAADLLEDFLDSCDDLAVRLSLCRRLREAGDNKRIITAGGEMTNDDDVSLSIKLLVAEAMAKEEMFEPAILVYRDCLRSKKRDSDLLIEARIGRASTYLALDKSTQAKKDVAELLAVTPENQDVIELANKCGLVGESKSQGLVSASEGAASSVDSAPTDLALPSPGWYSDPSNPSAWRWWDGVAWTEHVNRVS